MIRKINLKFKDNFYPIFFIVNLFLVFQISNFFYLATEGPDYSHLYKYIEYAFGLVENTNRDLGYGYFNIIAIIISTQLKNATTFNINHIIHNGILLTNYLFFLIGIFGLFKLLSFKEYSKKEIFLTFSVLCYFPQTINMLTTMKPEILAFSFITWIFYFIEKFLVSRDFKYIYFSIVPLSVLLQTKGSIFFFCIAIFLYMFLTNLSKFLDSKTLIPVILLCLFFLINLLENYKINNYTIFEHISSSPDGAYENIASFSIIFNLNFKNLIEQPFSNFHRDSVVGIILLDTFGDYFNLWAFNDESLYIVNKIKIKPFWYITHYPQFNSIILTIFLYFFLIYCFFKDKQDRIYFVAPFFALMLLLLNSFGIPTKNFNPETGDTFKTHYYSFLICISFAFVVIRSFRKNIKYFFVIFLILFISSAHLYGFPKSKSTNLNEYLNNKNSVSVFCKFNSILISSFETNNCDNLTFQYCQINRIINNTDVIKPDSNLNLDFKYFYPISLKNDQDHKIGVVSRDKCINYINDGYFQDKTLNKVQNYSIFNLFSILFSITLFCYVYYSEYKK